ncbi:MAG: sporulation protein YtfJ [Clostridia bacterium]|nr:sporulation protein YtfJ [Clostridia bacterium]
MANPIKELIQTAITSLDGMFSSDSVIGETVTAPDGTMIIPITKVSFGVGGGGSEFKETDKDGNNLFGGGVGAGASIKPQGFLVVTKSGSVRFVTTEEQSTAVDKLIDYAPDMVDKISGFFIKGKNTKDDNTEG